MHQEEEISDLLREHVITDSNSTRAPISTDCYEVRSIDSALIEATSTNRTPTVQGFQSLVGSLLWVALYTRPCWKLMLKIGSCD